MPARLAFVSIASIAGFMLGPMLGVIIARFAEEVLTLATPAHSIGIPLAATALLALSVASAVVFAVPSGEARGRLHETKGASLDMSAWLLPKLLILTFIVSAGVGAFEVGLALRGKQELGLTPYQIALMFTECGLVMFLMQAIVFSPGFNPAATRWLIAPALATFTTRAFRPRRPLGARDGGSDPTALDGADDLIVIALQSAVRQPLTRINRSLLPDARVATRR